MSRSTVFTAAVLGLFLFPFTFFAEAQDAAVPSPVTQDAVDNSPQSVIGDGLSAAPQPDTGRLARGLRLNKQGQVVGYVVTIEPNSLKMVPVPNAVVSFMQRMKIIAQAKSDADGKFEVENLTPLAVYSMFVNSGSWVSVVGTCVLPATDNDEAAAESGANRFVFVSQVTEPGAEQDDETMPDAISNVQYQVVQTVSWEDFYAAVNQGLFGNVAGPVAPVPGITTPGVGGGGGGAGGGAGAALGAAAAAAGIGGAIGAGQDEDLATPFTPN